MDAHSKWAEVVELSYTTTSKTIEVLRNLFALHGIPEQVVSDNGAQFTSADFVEFMRTNRIQHTRSAPYHPSSNGEAERFVRTFKEAMKASRNENLTFSHNLANFLLTYRTTPNATTGIPPCELLMKRSLRTRWDLLRPETELQVCKRQAQQKEKHDQHARKQDFQVGQSVMVNNMGTGPRYIPGMIIQKLGPVIYIVGVSAGRTWKRHSDQIKSISYKEGEVERNDRVTSDLSLSFGGPTLQQESPNPEAQETSSLPKESPNPEAQEASGLPVGDCQENRLTSSPTVATSAIKCYPSRTRVPPDRYKPSTY